MDDFDALMLAKGSGRLAALPHHQIKKIQFGDKYSPEISHHQIDKIRLTNHL